MSGGSCETPMADHVASFWEHLRNGCRIVELSGETWSKHFGGKGFPEALLADRQATAAEITRLRSELDAALAARLVAEGRVTTLEAKVERFMAATEPTCETKAAYWGEFAFSDVTGHDDEGQPIYGKTYVPWTTVKEIMAAIRARSLTKGGE